VINTFDKKNDSNTQIPSYSEETNFQHDYILSQQHMIKECISELKALLKHHDVHNPEIQEQIQNLRHQMITKDLPSVGLNERKGPTISDALHYIDKQSGYNAHLENLAPANGASSTKKSARTSWRRLAQGTPSKSTFKGHANSLVQSTRSEKSLQDTPGSVEQNIQNWIAAHPNSKLGTQCQKICNGIEQMKSNTELTGDSVRSWIQVNHDPDISKLFNTNIFQTVSLSDLQSFFDAVGLDRALLPQLTKPTAPPSKAGFVTYTFKNLPDRTPDGAHETTVQVGGQIEKKQTYIKAINPDGSVVFSDDPNTSIPKRELPTFKDSDGNLESYVFIPNGMVSGRIYYNGSQNTANTGFSEFSVDENGTPYTNFTAVDGIPTLTSNVQMYGDQLLTNRNGIQTDFATLSNRMKALYNQYDPSGAWAKGMFAADGSIRSGKHMSGSEIGDPRIENSLSNYLTGTFFNYFANHPLYFTADAPTPGTQSGVIEQTGPKSWVFRVNSAGRTIDLPLPSPTNLNGWISGAFGPDGDDTPDKNIMWGAAKALSSIINKGILPQDINTSPTSPMNGASYFDNPENVKNFYQAPFYNIYLRSMHEAGCSAYGADFDDYMGGDGTVSDGPVDHPWVTISFGATTPPSPPTSQITNDLFDPSRHSSVPGYWNGASVVEQMNQVTSQMNQEIAAYNKNPSQDAWNQLNVDYTQYKAKLSAFQASTGMGVQTAYQILKSYGKVDIQAIIGSAPVTDDLLKSVAQDMASREITPADQLPPSPSRPFSPSELID
jgi:hypothetical protein